MKNLLLSAAAGLALTAAMAPAAHADVSADWLLLHGKLTVIIEPTLITKNIVVKVTDTKPLDSEASALVNINSSVTDATVGAAHVRDPKIDAGSVPTTIFHTTNTSSRGARNHTSFVGKPDFFGDPLNFDIHRSALITGSILHNTGIGEVNQDVGNNSNQGNVIAAAFVFGGNDFVDSEAYVEQLSEDNSSRDVESFTNLVASPQGSLIPLVPLITADMEGSLNNNTGVFFVNQNAGNNNQQHNALAAAVGDNAFTALADAGLHQVNSGNTSYDINTVKSDTINNSIQHNTGIVAFNQSVGNNNNQATVVNVAAISSAVGLP